MIRQPDKPCRICGKPNAVYCARDLCLPCQRRAANALHNAIHRGEEVRTEGVYHAPPATWGLGGFRENVEKDR